MIGIPLLFEIVCFSALYVTLLATEEEVRQEAFAKSVSQHMNVVAKLVMQAGSSLYLYGEKGDSELYLEPYRLAIAQIPREFHELRALLAHNPEKSKAIAVVEETVERVLGSFDEARRAARKRDLSLAVKYITEVKELSIKASKQMDMLAGTYNNQAEQSSARLAGERHRLKLLLVAAIVASIILSVALYTWFNDQTLSRLATVVDNSRRFAGGSPLNPRLHGHDEIADLDGVFHEMADALTQAAREKQEFMAMITHDIRSPLTAVIGSLTLLSEPKMGFDLSIRAIDTVSRALANVQRLMRLVNDLLDIEKLEAGKMKMHFEQVPFAYVLEQSLEAMRPLADQKKINLVAPLTDVDVYADGDRLVQVMINLISNALKYSPSQGTVEITLDSDGSYLETRITDCGPGIPSEYKSKMFQRFAQVDLAERKQYGGTGLGLAICKEIVTAHNGSIGVESIEGEGTTFWFRIPASREVMEGPERS